VHKILRFSIIYCLIFRIIFNAPYFHYIIQTIGHVSIPKRHSFSPLCLFCACGSSVLQNFKIFTHLLTEVEFESCVECNYFNDTSEKLSNATVKYLFYNTEKISRILFYNLQEKFFELFLPCHLFVVTIIIR
jgi:hypothetical protein